MHIAAIYDIHGNLPALEAVLRDVERERPDLIVFGGDAAIGPLLRPTIERLMALTTPAHFVLGNTDREVIAAFDGRPTAPGLPQVVKDRLAWEAGQLDRAHRDFLASFTPPVAFPADGLGDVLFCHGSPRDVDEIITAVTSDKRLARIVAAVTQPLVVCGHSHMQFDRRVGNTRVVNAGSVGSPHGDPGAYWLLLGPDVSLRRTDYDLDDAIARIRAGGYPWSEVVEHNLLHPAGAAETAARFERLAVELEQRAQEGDGSR